MTKQIAKLLWEASCAMIASTQSILDDYLTERADLKAFGASQKELDDNAEMVAHYRKIVRNLIKESNEAAATYASL